MSCDCIVVAWDTTSHTVRDHRIFLALHTISRGQLTGKYFRFGNLNLVNTMAGLKRKEPPSSKHQQASPTKKTKKRSTPIQKHLINFEKETETDSEPIVESDTNSESGEDDGVSWPEDDEPDEFEGIEEEEQSTEKSNGRKTDAPEGYAEVVEGSKQKPVVPCKAPVSPHTLMQTLMTMSSFPASNSRESHTKQKALARERKATKPNAESVARSKKLWEQLRRKSHVPLQERRTLIHELFSIITGHVRDFVFKHDSVRVIQTALKYANKEQRRMITKELEGDYRTLAEGRYSKFLLGKMLVYGDTEIRDLIVPAFYGSVKKLIGHPEASWVLDDIYRGAASDEQKAVLLREWYGAEFAIFLEGNSTVNVTADLKQILEANSEKKAPIFKSLHGIINQLVQKRKTGFTMLHDAMLQYFHNLTPGSSSFNDFMELLKSDEEGDLLKNLAFTASGSELVSLALAYGSAKDRKQILKVYKGTIQSLAYDKHGRRVLLTAYEVIDDTQLTSKTIFPELLGKDTQEPADVILPMTNDSNARVTLQYLYWPDGKGVSLPPDDQKLLSKIRSIRATTSKKNPVTRRQELLLEHSPPLLRYISLYVRYLVRNQAGCQFITDILLGSPGDPSGAFHAIAEYVNAFGTKHEHMLQIQNPAATDRMLKALVLGGRYNPKTQRVEKPIIDDQPMNFHDILYAEIPDAELISWATGPHSFVIVAMLEAEGFGSREKLLCYLSERRGLLQDAADGTGDDGKGKGKGNPGAKLLLEKL